MYLQILVAFCGATVMIMEIVASRFFAPYIGSSIVVWTSLIGVVMAGLSTGYWMGGKLGDSTRKIEGLKLIVLIAGVWMLGLTVARDPVLRFLSSNTTFIETALVGALVLLFIPSVLLGMVTPYAVRLSASDVAHIGRTAGSLSALSTIGSIAGTFLAGFALVPSFGTTAILFITASGLIVLSTFRMHARAMLKCSAFLALALLVAFAETALRSRANAYYGVVYETDTQYSVIRVIDVPEGRFWWDGLLLEIDSGFHAAIDLQDENNHVFNYTPYYFLGDALRPDLDQGLLIGGGGYTVARHFLRIHEDADLTVVEIDPGVTEIARKYFRLQDDPRMTIYHEDGRMFLNRLGPAGAPGSARGKYQVVYGDAFRADKTIPFHLTTRESMRKISDILDERGIFVMNAVGTIGGANRFLRAQVATLREVFPTVLMFTVPGPDGMILSPDSPRNIMLLASKQPLTLDELRRATADDPELNSFIDTNFDLSTAGVTPFTDNFAPAEALLNLH